MCNIPTIRFKDFTDEWVESKLGDVADIIMGQSPKSNNYTNNPNDYIFVQGNADIHKGYVKPRVWTTQSTKLVKCGTILMSVRAPVGNVNKTNYDVVIGRGIAGILGNEFIFQFLKRINISSYWDVVSTGTTFSGINKNLIINLDISIPSLEEQTRIGSLFSKLDKIITNHEKQLDNLQTLKKASLQRMFPRDGKSKPELRFDGFTDDWLKHRIGDIFTVTRGNVLAMNKISPYKTNDTPYPVYSSQTKNKGLVGYYHEWLYDTAITWTTDGAHAGTVMFRPGKFYSTNVNGVLLSEIGYANTTVSEILNKEAWKWVSHVGNPKLMNNVMSDICILIPSLEEQERIGHYFKQLDDRIKAQETKIEQLKLLKKGLLQHMFI